MIKTESQPNPCKEKGCNACCQNMTMHMNMTEFATYSKKYRESKRPPGKLRRKSSVIDRGERLPNYYLSVAIWYAAKRTLEEHLETGRYGNTETVVLLEGICPNNKNGNCTIYEQRPRCCRSLEVHDKSCQRCQENLQNEPNFISINDIGIGMG
jgi:Fe-S-cluster containining protein